MKLQNAEKLRTDWKLRVNPNPTCNHRLREAQGDNRFIGDVYICVRCGDPITGKPAN